MGRMAYFGPPFGWVSQQRSEMSDVAAVSPARTWNWVRLGAFAGIGAVILWVAAFLTIGDTTDKDKAAEILAAYKADDGRIIAGTIMFLIGVGLFFFFLGALRDTLAAAEGPVASLTRIAYAGGVATGTCLALLPGGDMAGALNNDDLDASAALALNSVGDAFFLAAEYLLPVLLVGTALVALRTRVLPAWLAWLSLLIALVLLTGYIGWAALLFAFPIWVLIVSIMLWRGTATAATAV